MPERVNPEIRRRAPAVRISPKRGELLARAPAIGIHEDQTEAGRYLNMIHLKAHRRERVRKAA